MEFCCLCGMARSSPIHLCTAEVVNILGRTANA